jgi:hypothetical protein
MSAQSTALAPAGRGPFARQSRSSTRLAIAAIVVAGAIVAGATAVAISRGSAAPLAATGATGHAAPVTSSFERALEAGSATTANVDAPSWTSVAIGPESVSARSGITGLTVQVPSASSPFEQATAAQLDTSSSTASTLVIAGATGLATRIPAPSSAMEQALASQPSAAGPASTVLTSSSNGFAHRMPLR